MVLLSPPGSTVSEHAFLVAMLGFVAFLTLVGLYLGYLVHRASERIEGITAATYLEVRKVLGQSK